MCTQLNFCAPPRARNSWKVPALRRAAMANHRPSTCGPPSPARTRFTSGVSALPSPSTIAIRRATRRVAGRSPAKSSPSQAFATSTENPEPSSPVDSVIGRSSACR